MTRLNGETLRFTARKHTIVESLPSRPPNDGKTLVTADVDGRIVFWDLKASATPELAMIRRQDLEISDVLFRQ